MASYVNEVRLLGYAGIDPEVHVFDGGGQVTNINLATTRYYRKGGSEDWNEETTWHRLVFYGKSAEQAAEWFHKGSRIYVEGYIRTRKVEEKYFTDVVVDRFINLDPREDSDSHQGSSRSYSQPKKTTPSDLRGETTDPLGPLDDVDDDLPF